MGEAVDEEGKLKYDDVVVAEDGAGDGGGGVGKRPGLVSRGLSGTGSDQTLGSVPKDWAWSTF